MRSPSTIEQSTFVRAPDAVVRYGASCTLGVRAFIARAVRSDVCALMRLTFAQGGMGLDDDDAETHHGKAAREKQLICGPVAFRR